MRSELRLKEKIHHSKKKNISIDKQYADTYSTRHIVQGCGMCGNTDGTGSETRHSFIAISRHIYRSMKRVLGLKEKSRTGSETRHHSSGEGVRE